MLVTIFLFVLGLIIGGVGVRLAGRDARLVAAPRTGLARRTTANGEPVQDKDDGARIIGRLLLLLGVIMVGCGVIRLFAALVGS
jgi:hypothetical protein